MNDHENKAVTIRVTNELPQIAEAAVVGRAHPVYSDRTLKAFDSSSPIGQRIDRAGLP
jgi:hypothetical protein